MILVLFRSPFPRAGRLAPRTCDLRKTCKNLWFLQVLRMFALARTLEKSMKKCSEDASPPSRATLRVRNTIFSSFVVSKLSSRSPRGGLRGLLERLWGPLGRSWAAHGALLGALGRSWGALGRSLVALGALFGRSWALLGTSSPFLGDLGSNFAPPGGRFWVPTRVHLRPPRIDWRVNWIRLASGLRAAGG